MMHLTTHKNKGSDSADRPTLPTEIEITPAMIEAGVDALSCHNIEVTSVEELHRAVRSVFASLEGSGWRVRLPAT